MSYSRETLRAFSETLGALYTGQTPEAALQAVLPKLGALFHSRHVVIDELPTDGRPPIFHGSLNLEEWGEVPHYYSQFVHEHPGAPIVRSGGLLPVHRVSDFLTQRQFSDTGLYQECFRIVGAKDQICFGFRRPGSALAITLHRDETFSEDEAHLGVLLHEHIARILGDNQETAAGSTGGWELPVTCDGRITGMNGLFVELLGRYFPGEGAGDALPETVMRWMRKQIAALRTIGPGSLALRGLSVQAPCGRLHLHLRVAKTAELSFLLRINEDRGALDFYRLRGLGLTRRECEVVFWIAQGKRDAEIAVLLGCAPKTVGKHVENVLAKTGTETRLAAAHAAQEWLRREN